MVINICVYRQDAITNPLAYTHQLFNPNNVYLVPTQFMTDIFAYSDCLYVLVNVYPIFVGLLLCK